jgi:hypothetical protein
MDTQGVRRDREAEQAAPVPERSYPLPETIPRPTIWPAVLALGIVAGVWGVLTSLYVTGIGVIVSVVGIGGWIREIVHESVET